MIWGLVQQKLLALSVECLVNDWMSLILTDHLLRILTIVSSQVEFYSGPLSSQQLMGSWELRDLEESTLQ